MKDYLFIAPMGILACCAGKSTTETVAFVPGKVFPGVKSATSINDLFGSMKRSELKYEQSDGIVLLNVPEGENPMQRHIRNYVLGQLGRSVQLRGYYSER